MSVRTVVTAGYGSFGSIAAVVLRGYVPLTVDETRNLSSVPGFPQRADATYSVSGVGGLKKISVSLTSTDPTFLTKWVEVSRKSSGLYTGFVSLVGNTDLDMLLEDSLGNNTTLFNLLEADLQAGLLVLGLSCYTISGDRVIPATLNDLSVQLVVS